jgi:hypothetical protein
METRKCVRFTDEVSSSNIPYEDRKGEWTMFAIDRCQYKTRIKIVSRILEPVAQETYRNQIRGENNFKGEKIE